MSATSVSLAALRARLQAFDDEIKEFGNTLRTEVAEFKRSFEAKRKEFADTMDERERAFFAVLDGRIEHWRRNQKAIVLLLDAEIAQMSEQAAQPPAK